ncbi:MAG: PspA/IM30 family protein [Candidatus Altarchaeaceae archaeon]
MGVLKRAANILAAKINALLGRVEDPKEMLDYSYEKQKELLQKVNQGIANVMTAKKQLEIKRDELKAKVEKYQNQAESAMAAGREDLATIALNRKIETLEMIRSLDAQINNLEKNLENLKITKQKLEIKIQQFATKKEILKAQYDASKATVQVQESLTGLSEDIGDIKNTIDRIEEKIEKQKARAEAISSMIETGMIEEVDFGIEKKDDIDRELAKIGKNEKIESELKLLREKVKKEWR